MKIKVEKSIFDYRSRLSAALDSFDLDQITTFVQVLLTARSRGSTVFVAGNGGSASTSSHYSIDWAFGSGLTNPPLRVLSITDNPSSITATGNDQKFERVFLRQLENLAKPEDIIVLVSASGNSSNLIEMIDFAKSQNMMVVGITGFDGGRLKSLSDLSIHVETTIGDYGVAEDLHLVIGHAVKEALIAGSE
jgi:D-sedoheptulose 7-phosphate isomerase